MDYLIEKHDVVSSIEQVNGLYVAKYNGFYFESVFQPIVFSTGQCLGVEALVRIKSLNTGENINPYCFFQSLKSDVDTTNFGAICYGIHLRNFAHSHYHGVKLFLNVSPVTFSTLYRHSQAFEDTIDRLNREGLAFNDIVFEVTEFQEKQISDLVSGIEQFRN